MEKTIKGIVNKGFLACLENGKCCVLNQKNGIDMGKSINELNEVLAA